MLRVTVLVSGGGTNLQAVIDAIEEGRISNARIDVVISNNKKAYALERARKHGIQAVGLSPKDFENRDLFNEALYQELAGREIDLVVLAGCLVVIPDKIIREFENRIINIHPSLIPSFCGKGCYGLKVHEQALQRGVKISGATVHFVDEGTDTGPIIMQKAVEVRDDDTPEVLQRRIMEQAEWVILPEVINLIAEGSVSVSEGHVKIKK